jgi:ferredoxin, 2Fe-2S
MPRVFVTVRSGEVHVLEAEVYRTLMETIRDSGVGDLLALCGGSCSCATCHVYVDGSLADRLPRITDDEDSLLEGSDHRKTTSRLSCQIRMTSELDGLQVRIAPEDG